MNCLWSEDDVSRISSADGDGLAVSDVVGDGLSVLDVVGDEPSDPNRFSVEL